MRDTANNDLLVFEDIFPVENILEDAGFKSGGPTEWGSSFWKRALHCSYDAVLLRRHGFEATSKKALIIGILVHEALSLRYSRLRETGQCSTAEALGPVEAVSAWARQRLEQGPSQWAERLWACAETARELMVGYCARWEPYHGTPFVSHIETFDFSARAIGPVERILRAPDGGPFPWTQRLDLQSYLVEPDGSTVMGVVDHKTRSGTWDETPWSRMWWQEAQVWGAAYLCELARKGHEHIPPCRYVIINAMTKPGRASEPPTFDRYVYPISLDRLAVWKQSMKLHWDRLGVYFAISEGIPDEDLWRVVPMSFGGTCQRQYGSCPRFNACLQVADRGYVTQIQVVAPLPPAPEKLAESVPALPDQQQQAPNPAPAPAPVEEPHVELDPAVEFADVPGPDVKLVVDDFLGPAVQASATTRGAVYYFNTMLLWSRTPERNAQGECLFWAQGGVDLGVHPDKPGFIPVRIKTKSVPKAGGNGEVKPATGGPAPLEFIQTAPIGIMAKSTGMVPVFWLGNHTKAGKKLEERFREVSKGEDAYGIALSGKDAEKRSLKVWTWVSGMVIQSTKNSLGADGWMALERMALTAASAGVAK